MFRNSVVFVMLSFGLTAMSAQGAEIVSANGGRTPGAARVRVTELDTKRLRFELCAGLESQMTCSSIGHSDGYSREEISAGLADLRGGAKRYTRDQSIFIVGAIIVGGVQSDEVVLEPSGTWNSSVLERIFDSVRFEVLGGVSGTGIFVAKKLVASNRSDSSKTSSRKAPMTGSDKVIVIEDKVASLAKDLQNAFATLGK